MLIVIYLTILIGFSLSHALENRRQTSKRFIIPSRDHANFETAQKNCEIYYNGSLLFYIKALHETELRKIFDDYGIEPCQEADDCVEYYYGRRTNFSCQVILNTLNELHNFVYTRSIDCSNCRKYLCETEDIMDSDNYKNDKKSKRSFNSNSKPSNSPTCENSCNSHATCINSSARNYCKCNKGWTGNGIECSDINECTSEPCASPGGLCTNLIGSYDCYCIPGFTGDGYNCKDLSSSTITGSNITSPAAKYLPTLIAVIVLPILIVAVTIATLVEIYKRKMKLKLKGNVVPTLTSYDRMEENYAEDL